MKVWNERFALQSKEIKIKGMLSIADTLISVYNDVGIKAALLFDNKKACTYELAIPLKYLELVSSRSDSFEYHVILNGVVTGNDVHVQVSANGRFIDRSSPGSITVSLKATPERLMLEFPTEFIGKYTLANK